ncbi:MAG: hypothetical protein IJ958_08485 [Agathobacter sp.]|nr:hypothetical protein [Agathobacter sp.]
MKNQLKGIALILFGIIWMMFSMLDPWVPIIDDATILGPFIGLACGVVGIIFAFKSEE